MFEQVYNLVDDEHLLKLLGQVGSGPDARWFRFPSGPIGTDTWWNAVANQEIPTHTLEGTITKYFPHGEEHGQYAHFEVADEAGAITDWHADGEQGETRLYHVGDRVEIRYVLLNVLPDYPVRKELVLQISKRV